MPLTEQEAMDAACRFVRSVRRSLPYPVADVPYEHRRIQASLPPRVVPNSATIGSDFWEFDFIFQPPGGIMVDPHGVRIFVDSSTGAVALSSPR